MLAENKRSFFRYAKRYCKLSFAAIFLTYGKSDIKAFGFCDIIFVLFTRRSRISRGFTVYRIVDISLVLCTNIAEAQFLTECASTVGIFSLRIMHCELCIFYRSMLLQAGLLSLPPQELCCHLLRGSCRLQPWALRMSARRLRTYRS